jgi:hypothetical protein
MLFQRFDRLLFLAKGGQTVYFGEVGENASILTKYFERNGAHPCPSDANPGKNIPTTCRISFIRLKANVSSS